MRHDLHHLHEHEKADRVRRWAVSVPDPRDRERLEAVAREYEEMAEAVEHDPRAEAGD